METEMVSGIGNVAEAAVEAVSTVVSPIMKNVADAVSTVGNSLPGLPETGIGSIDLNIPSLNTDIFSGLTQKISAFDYSSFEKAPVGFSKTDLFKNTSVIASTQTSNESNLSLFEGPDVDYQGSESWFDDSGSETFNSDEDVMGIKNLLNQSEDISPSIDFWQFPEITRDESAVVNSDSGIKIGFTDPIAEVESSKQEIFSMLIPNTSMDNGSDPMPTSAQVLESLKATDSNTYIEVSEDLTIAGRINDILLDIGTNPTQAKAQAAEALKFAINRKGLGETIHELTNTTEQPIAEVEPETEDPDEVEEDIEPEAINLEPKTVTDDEEPDPVTEPTAKEIFVRDERANYTRQKVAEDALVNIETPIKGQAISGSAIISHMNTDPLGDEVSGIIKKQSTDATIFDGSIPRYRNQIKNGVYSSRETAREGIIRAVKENTAVDYSMNGSPASKEEVEKVLSTPF